MDTAEHLSLPPPTTPSSPLDNEQAPPYWSPHHGFYAPQGGSPNPAPNRGRNQPLTHFPSIQTSLTQASPTATRNPETASIASTTTPLPSYAQQRRWGRHNSEEEYLAALRAWAESKQWVHLGDSGIEGFYGDECLEERSRRMKAERVADKEAKAREKAKKKALVAEKKGSRVDRRESVAGDGDVGGNRRGSVGKWIARRRQSMAV